jgi:hypothetical protein
VATRGGIVACDPRRWLLLLLLLLPPADAASGVNGFEEVFPQF